MNQWTFVQWSSDDPLLNAAPLGGYSLVRDVVDAQLH